MRLAVAGKGGSGKTTVAGLLARSLARAGTQRLLAIDADSNPNLSITLGIPRDQSDQIDPIPRTVLKREKLPDGSVQARLDLSVEEIMQRWGRSAPDGITLLLMGRVDHAGAG